MPDNEGMTEFDSRDCFKEAVCIDAMRIYDSCSEKDPPLYKYIGKRKTWRWNAAGFAPFSLVYTTFRITDFKSILRFWEGRLG